MVARYTCIAYDIIQSFAIDHCINVACLWYSCYFQYFCQDTVLTIHKKEDEIKLIVPLITIERYRIIHPTKIKLFKFGLDIFITLIMEKISFPCLNFLII